MKLFISWSKSLSKSHARCFRDWIGKVFQEVEPFMSDQDISLGRKGIPVIEEKLNAIDFGVVFVSSENIDAPWINYEAGALSRAVNLPESKVVPILIDVDISDLGTAPLSGFQGFKADKEGMLRLSRSINESLARQLQNSDMEEAFDTWWPKLESCWSKIPAAGSVEKPQPTLESLSSQIDDLTKIIVSLRNSERATSNALLELLLKDIVISMKPINSILKFDDDHSPGRTNLQRVNYLLTLANANKSGAESSELISNILKWAETGKSKSSDTEASFEGSQDGSDAV